MGIIKLEWGNSCDIGDTMYQTGFKNVLYFDTIIGLPQTKTLTEGTQNGEGKLIPSFQRRAKAYEFQVFVPEYVIDALGDVRLHDNIRITQMDPYLIYEVTDRTSFVVSSSFEFVGCNAHAVVSFEASEVVIKTGCCGAIGLPPCPSPDFTVTACGDEHPSSPAIGDLFLFGGPKTGHPGYFDFTMQEWTGVSWEAREVEYGQFVYCGDVIYYFQQVPSGSETVDVYAPINTILSIESLSATSIKVKFKAAPGTWNFVEYSGDCSTYDTVNDPELYADDLEFTGITIDPVTECGNYCLKLISRKTGCPDLETIFTLTRIQDPLVIDLYVSRVYLANACPVPFWQLTPPTKVYLILPETPCTNVPEICDHQNEIITRNPLDHTLFYFSPTDCMTIYDKATGDVWTWNPDGNGGLGEWQRIIEG